MSQPSKSASTTNPACCFHSQSHTLSYDATVAAAMVPLPDVAARRSTPPVAALRTLVLEAPGMLGPAPTLNPAWARD